MMATRKNINLIYYFIIDNELFVYKKCLKNIAYLLAGNWNKPKNRFKISVLHSPANSPQIGIKSAEVRAASGPQKLPPLMHWL